jgi:DNA-directed RNA polymerase subunit H (RpoH/RPB5)
MTKEQVEKKMIVLEKENTSLLEQLGESRQHAASLQTSLSELSRNFETYQLQNNNQVGYLQPISEKLAHLLADSDEYARFMNQFEISKNKLMKISASKLQNYADKPIGELVREINIAAQRCKMQILNKAKVSQEDKASIVEEFKTLQGAIEKIIRC